MSGFSLSGSAWSRGIGGSADSVITYDATHRRVERDGRLIGDDIFDSLTQAVATDPEATWVGYLGYACRPDLRARGASGVPDAVWMKASDRGDAERDVEWPSLEAIPRRGLGLLPRGRGTPDPAPEYSAAFDEVQRRLRAGDSYEVNLTRRVDLGAPDVDPAEVIKVLQDLNPAPYSAHLWHQGTCVLSASPELFARIENGRLRTKPIKGTSPRAVDPEEDRANADRLQADPRYRAENLMITDLMRNDLSRVCLPGTVEVTGLMQVESYPAVHQLVSTIEGCLAPQVGVVEAIRSLFPAGSMTGAPKRRTMEIIDEVEETPRGIYSGVLGWISGDACELSVVIRSLIRDPAGRWHAGTGGGITVHSDAASEWAESEWKLNRLREALESG